MIDEEVVEPSFEAPTTIYWIEVLPSGRIYSSSSVPEDVTPDPLRGGVMVVTDGLCSPNESAYYDGQVIDIGKPETGHHEYDYALRKWVDLRDLEFYKAERWSLIKAARDEAEFGGFTWDGSVFDSDAVSQGRIRSASVFPVEWTLADNSTRTLYSADMANVVIALGEHINVQHERARLLRAEIAAATTTQKLEAIAWPAS